MGFESPPSVASLPETSHPAPVPPAIFKHRLRFSKTNDLRLVSHIDLLHCFERLLRRAALPFASTQGFHPKPKITFAQALALGVAAAREVVELELTADIGSTELLERLNAHAPAGIRFLSARPLDRKAKAQVRRAFYRLALPSSVADLPDRCADLWAQPHVWALRVRPHRRRYDLRPYLAALHATADEVTMALWITPYGAARPEEVAAALGLQPALEAGAFFERTDLEIVDEQPEGERWLPEIERLSDVPEPAAAANDPPPTEPERPRSATPHALIPNPLSFDT